MHTLWAPWRMDLILREKPAGCIFCQFPAEDQDPENLLLARSPHAFVVLNRFPYNNGHLMVIPRPHVPDLDGLAEEAFLDLHGVLRKSITLLRKVYRPEGLNVGMNVGQVAGAGIVDHCHYHVVPRWTGDTNFMPVLAETKIMNEHLQASYERLRPVFDEVFPMEES